MRILERLEVSRNIFGCIEPSITEVNDTHSVRLYKNAFQITSIVG